MNTLILSTGGLGSTILQRLITIVYHIENIKIINTHDIVNKVLMLDNDNNVRRNGEIQYGQSLQEVQNILKKSNRDTKLISRLSKDHIDFRKDLDIDQFYEFVKKFYKKQIFCERENVFELAMSLSIKAKSGAYNIFNDEHRKAVSNVSEVDEHYFIERINSYIKYRAWIFKHFPEADMVSYENLITNTDDVLFEITGYKNTLKNYLGLPMSTILRLEYTNEKLNETELNAVTLYRKLCANLVQKGTLREVPMKNSSLQDKKNRIKNFDKCLKIFYQHTRKFKFINQSKATYDFWNKKELI